MLKTVFSILLIITLITFVACSPSPEPSTTPAPAITPAPATTPALKKISLEDAPSILNISLLLPSKFEKIDPASEGMSNEDLALGPDVSEVVLYFSEEPFQMIWGMMGIISSRIEAAAFDTQIEDESAIISFIEASISEVAAAEGVEMTVPNMNISHPNIGDSAILGEGEIESYGFYYGFDIIWFRSGTVYVYWYSTTMSEDKVSLLSIASEVEKRIGGFSQ